MTVIPVRRSEADNLHRNHTQHPAHCDRRARSTTTAHDTQKHPCITPVSTVCGESIRLARWEESAQKERREASPLRFFCGFYGLLESFARLPDSLQVYLQTGSNRTAFLGGPLQRVDISHFAKDFFVVALQQKVVVVFELRVDRWEYALELYAARCRPDFQGILDSTSTKHGNLWNEWRNSPRAMGPARTRKKLNSLGGRKGGC